jgi:hypothetical protein
MKHPRSPRILLGACALALVALALMAWQLFEPGPLQVIVALSLGQLLGTASFMAYLFVVLRDLRTARKAARDALRAAGEE